MRVQTHHGSEATFRRIVDEDGETFDFEIVGDESDREGYEYQGEGQPPREAEAELEEWMAEHHGADESVQELVDDEDDRGLEEDVDEAIEGAAESTIEAGDGEE